MEQKKESTDAFLPQKGHLSLLNAKEWADTGTTQKVIKRLKTFGETSI